MSENKKPRLAEILGVKVGQEFRIEGDKHDFIYRVKQDGGRERRDESGNWWNCYDEEQLIRIINNPSLIHPIMQWTQDDIEDAKAVRRLRPECEWVARDEKRALWAYVDEPVREDVEFAYTDKMFNLPRTALPSVTWENNPVRIADILGDGE